MTLKYATIFPKININAINTRSRNHHSSAANKTPAFAFRLFFTIALVFFTFILIQCDMKNINLNLSPNAHKLLYYEVFVTVYHDLDT